MLIIENSVLVSGGSMRDAVQVNCPVCGAYPVEYWRRNQVARFFNPFVWLWRWWRNRPYPQMRVICGDCKEVIGYEEGDHANYVYEQRRRLPARRELVTLRTA